MSAKYGWVVTRDCLESKDVRVSGPRAIPHSLLARLLRGEGRKFRLYDDDDICYYHGSMLGEYSGFEPLDDYGMPNAGCTWIALMGRNGTWERL